MVILPSLTRTTGSRVAKGIVALAVLLMCCPRASALDPSLDVNQYAHTAWNVRDGFSKGRVTSFAQTPDGYLWLGTEFGLLRFDGVRSVPWQPPRDELPNNWIRSLITAPDGTLWIGTFRGLASWKNGKLSQYPELAGHDVYTLLVDHEGTVWAGGYEGVTGTLCAIQRDSEQCHGEGSGFGRWVGALYEDRGGNLWAAAQTGLWRWKPSPPTLHPMPDPVIGNSQALNESDDGKLLIATQDRISQLVNGRVDAYALPGTVPRFKPQRMLRDRDGGLWIGTLDRGLFHVHQGRTDLFTQANGLSGNSVTTLFEDREGNIWVATMDGLDRFRELAVRTISANQGLSSGSPWSVLASRDGSVWLGSNGGLSRWHDGQVTMYRKGNNRGLPDDGVGSLFEDHRGRVWVSTLRGMAYFEDGRFVPVPRLPQGHTSSIVGDTAGNLWLINDVQGLFHVREGRVVDQMPWARLALKGAATTLLLDPLRGGVWLGFDGGVTHVKDGQVRVSYAIADGGVVTHLRLDDDGTLWAASERGLSRVKDGHVVTLASKNGLPCDAVHWSMEDDDHAVWLYMACGLVRIASTELNAGFSDPTRRIQMAVFDGSDGVGLRGAVSIYDPHVAKGADGRLWFLPNDGVSIFDPRRLSINKLPPPVHVEQVTADHKTYGVSSDLRLPPLIRDLEIDYSALSLVAPEKNRFRVKLEGWDSDWQDVANRRQAFYNNLPPGQYRFRVAASNNSGVWNETGAFVDLSIAPAYYQTRWFKATVVAACLMLLWTLHRRRVRHLAREFNRVLDARVSERTRIARELHDTLLQSFQGLMLRFQSARDLLPAHPARAVHALDGALDRADQAISEGRDAIQNLRSSTTVTNELGHAMTALAEELAEGPDGERGSATFRVSIEGTPRDLHPILRDDVYRITREALRNAFRHAQARHIEVEITYGERDLRMRIRDDGKGMDPQQLDVGRPGHWGLPGMRERAQQLGAHLNLWSEVGAGTEVELRLPASVAYGTSDGRRGFRLFRRKDATHV
jgi:signal transduction histidine kinase/ligand-binding sensor domain-containing protein